MKNATVILGLALALSGCDDNPKCTELAEHVTKLLVAEKGEDISPEAKDKAKKDIVASCNSDAPDDAVLECAMKAESQAALLECDKLAKSDE